MVGGSRGWQLLAGFLELHGQDSNTDSTTQLQQVTFTLILIGFLTCEGYSAQRGGGPGTLVENYSCSRLLQLFGMSLALSETSG